MLRPRQAVGVVISILESEKFSSDFPVTMRLSAGGVEFELGDGHAGPGGPKHAVV